ncbi:helix-turn-helix domain-containing protein [Olivibacter jilunii]|uniref:helix-turn-helix domain-containing protein n=1 Tax=Olivibacter jilunii TaxID=985016 RepID=UPI00102FC092|nr:AraC family transcriptional regulator [Olivibacter jilunii]
MKILNQFDPLVIEDAKEANFTCAHHSHTYYELVYIHSGNGIHHLNEDKISYESGDLFLISPGEHHSFVIAEETHFTYIKFTESYFESKKHLAPDEFKIGSPEFLMEMKWLKEVKIVISYPCNEILKSTVNNLIAYSKHRSISSSPIAYYQLLSIFGMIKEILKERKVSLHKEEFNFEKLISFIHENIYDRERIAVRVISNFFNISPTYFSNYFKRHFGIPYQEYLNRYRVSLIEKRLGIGGLKLKQIADEFGFTDVSHLSKTFKKIKGYSPKRYNINLSHPR